MCRETALVICHIFVLNMGRGGRERNTSRPKIRHSYWRVGGWTFTLRRWAVYHAFGSLTGYNSTLQIEIFRKLLGDPSSWARELRFNPDVGRESLFSARGQITIRPSFVEMLNVFRGPTLVIKMVLGVKNRVPRQAVVPSHSRLTTSDRHEVP